MAKDKTTLRFWLRTDRPNKDGSAPVHLIYQIQGQRKYYAIPGLKVYGINWDVANQKAIFVDKKAAKKRDPSFDITQLPTSYQINEINSKLQDVSKDVSDIETQFRLHKKSFSPQMVIDRLTEMKEPETKKDEPGTYIVDFIRRFIKETTEHKLGTLKEYSTLASHMEDYENLKRLKFTFEGDASIMNGFSVFLTDVRQMNNITKSKHISTFKTMLRHAKRTPYKIKSNPDYLEFSIKRKGNNVAVIALTEDELEAIYKLKLTNKALDEARDIFCFSCATGLRYGDLSEFRRHHITRDNRIVMPSSDKNSKGIDIPLIPMSYAIIKKYADRINPLPVTKNQKLISNQKLNDNIKKVAELAGVDKEIEIVREYGLKRVSLGIFKKYELLSIHKGRKTFITLSLARGVAMQDVMAMSTHASFAAMKPYIDITPETKRAVMAKAYGEVPKSNLKAV